MITFSRAVLKLGAVKACVSSNRSLHFAAIYKGWQAPPPADPSRRATHCSYFRCSSTLSYDHGASDVPLVGRTIGKLVEERAAAHPDREAFIFPHQNIRTTFSQLLQHADEFAAGLLAVGLGVGDRLGVWSPNYYEWILAQYGTARAGIILVNINPAYQVPELEYALRKVGVKAILCPDKFKTQSYYSMLHEICPELEECHPGNLKSKRLPQLETVILMGSDKRPGAFNLSDVRNAGSNEDLAKIHNLQASIQIDDVINIQFTSGTTGAPKGASLTHHNIVNNSYFVGRRMGFHSMETRICVPVPLFHCFGMVLASLQTMTNGATCVFPSPAFQPDPALQAADIEKCTAIYGTPTMFIDMLHVPEFSRYDLSSLYTGIMAGSNCPVEIMKQVINKMHMDKFTVCYGTTENSPVTYQTFVDTPLDKRVSSVGHPAPHTETKVVDEAGRIVERGEVGELCIRGYCVMEGYWNDADRTAEAIDSQRWYHTGDRAVMDSEGYGYIVGRTKDMIVRGGENIYPLEVEQFLYTHPDVADVQVVGLPDYRLGEEVVAFIKLKQGRSTTVEEIKHFCKGKISHFKIPKFVHFISEYPLTTSGKVKKFVLREQAVDIFGDQNKAEKEVQKEVP